MKKNIALLSILTLGICSVALATEYTNPDVGFKPHVVPSKEMKTADFGDHFKVNAGVETDRQIASSQEEDSEREPSSFVKDKEVIDENEAVEAPKPWLFRMEADSRK